MARVRVKVNGAGVRQLLRSRPIGDFLISQTQPIVDRANAQTPAGVSYQVFSTVGRNRSRAAAQTTDQASRRHNAETNALLKALG